jgi:hypothetical protein
LKTVSSLSVPLKVVLRCWSSRTRPNERETVVVALVAAAIVVAGVALVVWARSYQPLAFTSGAGGVETEGVARRYDAENDEGRSPVRPRPG